MRAHHHRAALRKHRKTKHHKHHLHHKKKRALKHKVKKMRSATYRRKHMAIAAGAVTNIKQLSQATA